MEENTASVLFHAESRLNSMIYVIAQQHILKSKIDIRVVKEILGHAQISTTMIYTHVLDEIKQKEMGKLRFE